MIKNTLAWREFEDDLVRSEPPDFERNLRLFEAMRLWAIHLGVWEREDPMDGIQLVIRVAKVLNHVFGNPGESS